MSQKNGAILGAGAPGANVSAADPIPAAAHGEGSLPWLRRGGCPGQRIIAEGREAVISKLEDLDEPHFAIDTVTLGGGVYRMEARSRDSSFALTDPRDHEDEDDFPVPAPDPSPGVGPRGPTSQPKAQATH
jgi:hypothetical protein